MNSKPTIIFMGTPEFAVPSLEMLHQSGFPIPLVVTQPDRPRGRGRKLAPPPVKVTAIGLGLDIFQPQKIRDEHFIDRLKRVAPDFLVTVAFGRILTAQILEIPRIAAVNVHPSLLPKYRGPAPIQWAVINAEKETGVTTMLMDEGLDEGDILLSEKVAIAPDETAASLHDRLAHLGGRLLVETLTRFAQGDLTPGKQDPIQASYAPLIHKNDGRIIWKEPAEKLDHFIRGMTPWPGAFAFHGSKRLKIWTAQAIDPPQTEPPGTVLEGFPGDLWIAAGKGALEIHEIQAQSGKRLKTRDFLRGYSIPAGSVLE